jgi:hypothetical protein
MWTGLNTWASYIAPGPVETHTAIKGLDVLTCNAACTVHHLHRQCNVQVNQARHHVLLQQRGSPSNASLLRLTLPLYVTRARAACTLALTGPASTPALSLRPRKMRCAARVRDWTPAGCRRGAVPASTLLCCPCREKALDDALVPCRLADLLLELTPACPPPPAAPGPVGAEVALWAATRDLALTAVVKDSGAAESGTSTSSPSSWRSNSTGCRTRVSAWVTGQDRKGRASTCKLQNYSKGKQTTPGMRLTSSMCHTHPLCRQAVLDAGQGPADGGVGLSESSQAQGLCNHRVPCRKVWCCALDLLVNMYTYTAHCLAPVCLSQVHKPCAHPPTHPPGISTA